MNRIKRWWNKVSGKLVAEGEQPRDVTAIELCRMLQKCPVCAGEFTEHNYALFAVTVLGDDKKERLREFFDACEEHRWEEAQKFQDFDQNRDAVVAYAMKCSDGKVALVMERSPCEIYETDRLIACNVLDEDIGTNLEKIIPHHEWRNLSGSGAA